MPFVLKKLALLSRPLCCWRPCFFNIHAVFCVSAVFGVLLLLISLRKKTKTIVRIFAIFLIFWLYFVFPSSVPLHFTTFNFRGASDFDCFSSMRNKRKINPFFFRFEAKRFLLLYCQTKNEQCTLVRAIAYENNTAVENLVRLSCTKNNSLLN